MIHIALFETDKASIPVIAGATRAVFEARGSTVEIDTLTRIASLLSALDSKLYDLVLLDIDIPGLDVTATVDRIKSLDQTIPVILISADKSFDFGSFPLQSRYFVCKSTFLTDIVTAIEKIQKYWQNDRSSEHIDLMTRTGHVSIRLALIRYIEGSRNYQLVHLKKKGAPLELNMTMADLEEKLQSSGFIRIHKSYLVNYRFISSLKSDTVILHDRTRLPVGRSKTEEVRTRYLLLIRDSE